MERLKYFLICLLAVSINIEAQDLRELDLRAEYTFISNVTDATGNYENAKLVNAPISDQGVRSHGGYVFQAEGLDSSLVQTPNIDHFLDEAFAIELEFFMDTLDEFRPIVVVGEARRHLGMAISNDGSLYGLFNGNYSVANNVIVSQGEWHRLVIFHVSVDSLTTYFLDGKVILEKRGALLDGDDLDISNTHFGQGEAFRGLWKNLRVYSGDRPTSISNGVEQGKLEVFPNPCTTVINVKGNNSFIDKIEIFDLLGNVICSHQIKRSEVVQLQLNDLNSGIYILIAVDENGHGYSYRVVKN